jgi:hypothetical protein
VHTTPAYVTVTDAAGRVLFRRLATAAEVEEAIQIAQAADAEAENVLKRIAKDRDKVVAAEAQRAQLDTTQVQVVESTVPQASAETEELVETKGDLPEYEGESDFPDFVEGSAPVPHKPIKAKADDNAFDAFSAFGDTELDFLDALSEDKGKK